MPASRRILTLAAVDGAGSGLQNAVLGILLTQRFGVVAASVVVAVSTVGRLAAPVLANRLADSARVRPQRAFRWGIAAMVAGSLAAMASAAWGPLAATAVAAVVWAAANQLTTAMAVVAVPHRIVQFGPVSMAGHAAGAVIGVVCLGLPGAPLWLAACVVAQFAEPPLLAGVELPADRPEPQRSLWGPGVRGLVLAGLTYGPLAIYPALTIAVAGVEWVGWSMAAYAAGALTLARLLERHLPGSSSWTSTLLIGGLGVLTWAAAVNGPALLLVRFLGGGLVFAAQGRLIRLGATRPDGGVTTAGAAAVTAGLGVGAGLGAVLAGVLAGINVPAMAVVLCAAAVVAAAAVWGRGRLTPTTTAGA